MDCCKFCNKNFVCLLGHIKYCKLNPNKSDARSGKNNPMYGKKGGNQFTKAKDMGTKVYISDETRIKLGNANRNKKWSIERKRKHSDIMRKAVLKNPDSYSSSNVSGRVKNYEYNGMTLKGTWELIVAKSLYSENIKYTNKIVPFEYIWEGSTHLYFPDFYLEDYDLYIEVKGYKRERDVNKWKVVDNLIVFESAEIKMLQNTSILDIINKFKIDKG